MAEGLANRIRKESPDVLISSAPASGPNTSRTKARCACVSAVPALSPNCCFSAVDPTMSVNTKVTNSVRCDGAEALAWG
jgi:hypothetical protein